MRLCGSFDFASYYCSIQIASADGWGFWWCRQSDYSLFHRDWLWRERLAAVWLPNRFVSNLFWPPFVSSWSLAKILPHLPHSTCDLIKRAVSLIDLNWSIVMSISELSNEIRWILVILGQHFAKQYAKNNGLQLWRWSPLIPILCAHTTRTDREQQTNAKQTITLWNYLNSQSISMKNLNMTRPNLLYWDGEQ